MSSHCHSSPSTSRSSFRFWLMLGGLALSLVSMLFGMPGMIGWEPSSTTQVISAASAAVVVLVLGWPFLLGIPQIFYKPNMNTLVGFGVVAAFALSIYNWVSEQTGLYFDSAAMIVAFVSVGHYMEALIRRKIDSKIPEYKNLVPQTAHVLKAETLEDIKSDLLEIGASIRVLPGERVPADGRLLSESAELNESLLTGESRIVSRQKDETVVQGAIVEGQPIELEVIATKQNSFLESLSVEVRDALNKKAGFQKTVDRWAGIFVYLVIVVAAVTYYFWAFLAPDALEKTIADFAFQKSIAVLIIACPCALGLATPLAYLVSFYRALKQGILIRDLSSFERVEEITQVAFDKTGTLTEGLPSLKKIQALENIKHDDVLQLAAAVERDSDHPYARAIKAAAASKSLKPLEVREYHFENGKGVRALVQKDGKVSKVCLGNQVWLYENGLDATEIPDSFRWEAEGAEGTVLWLTIEDKLTAIFILEDPLRTDAAEAVGRLKEAGYDVGLISGDAEPVTLAIAKKLQLNFFHHSMSPREKAVLIKRLQEKKKKGLDFEFPKLAYVGDGVNDALALTEAHLGLAMGSGTSLAQSSAEIILRDNQLKGVQDAFRILKGAKKLIFQNLGLALIYNILAIPLAAGVLFPSFGLRLEPELAAIAMSLSSISVVLNSLRALKN